MLRSPALHAAALATLLLPASASAQAGREGLSLSAHVYAAQLSIDDGSDESSDSGGGIAGEVAYGFTPRLAAFLALGGAVYYFKVVAPEKMPKGLSFSLGAKPGSLSGELPPPEEGSSIYG